MSDKNYENKEKTIEAEMITQKRLIKLFKNELGFKYLGNFKDIKDNKNIKEELLKDYLKNAHYEEGYIKKAIEQLKSRLVFGSESLFTVNERVYESLRYGEGVKNIGEDTRQVCFIDFDDFTNNDFYIAEEVSVRGLEHDKRPDLVLYINGIAIAVIELKKACVDVYEGVRQNRLNQEKSFIREFFATIQLVCAGNDSQGLRYASIEADERHSLKWLNRKKADLDEDIREFLNKKMLIRLMRDYLVHERGIKKICRPNQYKAVEAAKKTLKEGKGGIIWHSQGSGKSITMLFLARWIRTRLFPTRVLIMTDRIELDAQIKGIFTAGDEEIYRTKSGADLIKALKDESKGMICSTMQKSGAKKNEEELESFCERCKNISFTREQKLVVFIDECHRTQGGKLHNAMRSLLGKNTPIIGFTGTPRLKKKELTSKEIFGEYIDIYSFKEAVRDKVIVDLCYENRDIVVSLKDAKTADQFFESKTRGLNEKGKELLRKKWVNMSKLYSTKERLEKIASDILLDMSMNIPKDQNAILVCDDVYNACRMYLILEANNFGDKCAVISSYTPKPSLQTAEGTDQDSIKYKAYVKMLTNFYKCSEKEGLSKLKDFEAKAKKLFINEPLKMRLLIVVDKLLTGFDAPSASFLYIDKKMQDLELFQAVCRVNRLYRGKEMGRIIDYQDLLKPLEKSMKIYSEDILEGAFPGLDAEDIEGLLKSRLIEGRKKLEEARELIKALCEGVCAPFGQKEYLSYFEEKEKLRYELYKASSSYLSKYLFLNSHMREAGFNKEEEKKIKAEVKDYSDISHFIAMACGDRPDMKSFAPAMRELMDLCLEANSPKIIASFDMGLIKLLENEGVEGLFKKSVKELASMPSSGDIIKNNIRKILAQKKEANPLKFEKISKRLEDLIDLRDKEALNYADFLSKLKELYESMKEKESSYPSELESELEYAFYDNLGKDLELILKLRECLRTKKLDGWKGNKQKTKILKNALYELFEDEALVEITIGILKEYE